VRLRRLIARRHRQDPFDLVYQFSNIETPALPSSLRREVPLVIHPETHAAGELRSLLAERRLSMRCQPWYEFALVIAIMAARTVAQRRSIRHARLLICISSVFRDHLVADYAFPAESTVVVPNPVQIDRFALSERTPARPPTVLVLGRISARKGIDDVIAVAKTLLERNVDVRVRVVGGPSLWSDYTKLLDELPRKNSRYTGSVAAADVPALLRESDLLLQASTYEPFALTVGEALAAGVPVIATSEVGAIEGVDRSVVAEVQPGDVDAMAGSIARLLNALELDAAVIRATAREEAERLFAPEVVCEQISAALHRLLDVAPRQPTPSETAGAPPTA
jgi:glycosyltransferase involved in cell wall biosynthesis